LQPTDERYIATLDTDGLAGAHIGVLRERFGDRDDPRAGPVCDRVDAAMARMREAGADFVDPVDVPDIEAQLERSSLHALQPKHDINAFLADLEDPPVDSVEKLHRTDAYHSALELFETIAHAPSDPGSTATYWQSVAAQESLREDLLYALTAYDLDALLFPSVQVVPPKHAALRAGDVGRVEYPVNTVIPSQASCPSVTMPAGFTEVGIPVGVELLGQPLAERRLLAMAAAYERHTDLRQPPAAAPPLGTSDQ
jgi:Asp-tRNA(Asn)/Glu-tRNA(Gln) amidotransferase A subunit family amidase